MCFSNSEASEPFLYRKRAGQEHWCVCVSWQGTDRGRNEARSRSLKVWLGREGKDVNRMCLVFTLVSQCFS